MLTKAAALEHTQVVGFEFVSVISAGNVTEAPPVCSSGLFVVKVKLSVMLEFTYRVEGSELLVGLIEAAASTPLTWLLVVAACRF